MTFKLIRFFKKIDKKIEKNNLTLLMVFKAYDSDKNDFLGEK